MGFIVKDAENHLVHLAGFFQECSDFPDSDLRRLTFWIALDARTDRRKGNALKAVFGGETQALSVARSEQFSIFGGAAIDRPNGVDDVPARQGERGGDFGFARVTTPQLPASFQELFTSSTMNRTVNAATTKQRPVGCVDDGVDFQSRDVFPGEFDALHCRRLLLLVSADRLIFRRAYGPAHLQCIQADTSLPEPNYGPLEHQTTRKACRISD